MKNLFVVLFVLLLIVPLVSAVSPVIEANEALATESLTIVYPICSTVDVDRSVNLSFDILNSTFSKVDNSTTYCNFFIQTAQGGLIDSGNLLYSTAYEYWSYELNNSLIEEEGCYSYYVHCNNSGEEYGYLSQQLVFKKGGEVLHEYNNYSFLTIVIIFMFITILIVVSLFIVKKIWLKVVLSVALSIALTTLLRFAAWFMEITNPSETVLIKTINSFYAMGVRSMYLLLAGAMIFLVVYIVNSIRSKPRRNDKDSWANWGKDEY